MEMKERLELERKKYEELEVKKRQEILDMKEMSAKDLECRANQIQRLREKRAVATRAYYAEKERELKENSDKEEKTRQEHAVKLVAEMKVTLMSCLSYGRWQLHTVITLDQL